MDYLFLGHDFAYRDFYSSIARSLPKGSSIYLFFSRIGPTILPLDSTGCVNTYYLCPSRKNSAEKNQLKIDLGFYSRSHEDGQILAEGYRKAILSILPEINNPLVVLPGEFRLIEQVFRSVIDEKYGETATVLYFEVGPPGYVYFSPYGTNAQSGFNPLIAQLVEHAKQSIFDDSNEGLENTIPKSEGLLKVFDYLNILFSYYVFDRWDYHEYVSAFSNKFLPKYSSKKVGQTKRASSSNDDSYRRILFCGQVETDVNHTHFGVSTDVLIKRLVDLVNNNDRVVLRLRHHPLYINVALENELRLRCLDKVEVLADSSIANDIQDCVAMVTVNSNAGLECLREGKPVLVLGRSYYDGIAGVFKSAEDFMRYCNSTDLASNSNNIIHEVEQYFHKYFLDIDYRSRQFKNSYQAARFIQRYGEVSQRRKEDNPVSIGEYGC